MSVGHFKMEETPSKRPKLDMSSGNDPPFKLVDNQNKSVVLEDFFVKFPKNIELGAYIWLFVVLGTENWI